MAFAWSRESEIVVPEEYLRRERDASTKSEFLDGRILAMAGASPRHNRIAGNVYTALDNALIDSETCEPFNSDQKVRLHDEGPFFYPDVSLACEPVFDGADCLRNPALIVEVLSKSTEQTDRVTKWLYYQRLPSLRCYVLVSQDWALVEVFERLSENSDWIYRSFSDVETEIPLTSLGLTLPLSQIYRRISFPFSENADAVE
jgi:Uma2 family endonuclease